MLKQCTQCGETKPREAFYSSAYHPDGLAYQCKTCGKDNSRQCRAKMSPEKKKKELKRLKDWQAKNQEKVRIKRLRHNSINKTRRASRKNGLPATLTSKQWQETLSTLDYKCVYCGSPWEHQDHFIPLAKNGGYTINNILPSCSPCNVAKADKMPFDFIRENTEESMLRLDGLAISASWHDYWEKPSRE